MFNSRPTTYDRRLNTIIAFVVGCLLLVVGQAARASVSVVVDTGVETINAVEGTLILPTGISVEEIYTGNSAVLIWITRPVFDAAKRTITFAGLTPGGFRGKQPLFTLLGPDMGSLSGATFTSTRAYRNDGEGTPVQARFSLASAEVPTDTAPPEPFSLTVSSSPEAFDGAYFLSFAAQDKGTGIQRYEFVSSWFFSPGSEAAWAPIDSPKLLSRKDLFKRLHVRALDHSGNFREVSTAGPYWYITFLIGFIIIVCVALFITRSLSLPFSPSFPQ